MKERVTTRLGTNTVVFVAPHGHDLDDTNTGVMALAAADVLDAYAIVNNGFRRGKAVDEIAGVANCNNIDHCKEAVVKAEFLDPIYDAVDTIQNDDANNNNATPLVLMVHGVGNSIRTKSGDPKLDLIVGFGAGDKPRYTCREWVRDAFMDLAGGGIGWKTYAGAPGGDYSARSSKNLTQALHRVYGGSADVLQLEFVYAKRHDEKTAKAAGESLAVLVKSILALQSYTRPANIKAPPQI